MWGALTYFDPLKIGADLEQKKRYKKEILGIVSDLEGAERILAALPLSTKVKEETRSAIKEYREQQEALLAEIKETVRQLEERLEDAIWCCLN